MPCLEGDSRVYTLLCHCHNLEKFLFTPFLFLTEKLPSLEVEIYVLYIHPLLSINIGISKEPLPNKGEVKETFFHVNTCWQLGCQFMRAPMYMRRKFMKVTDLLQLKCWIICVLVLLVAVLSGSCSFTLHFSNLQISWWLLFKE